MATRTTLALDEDVLAAARAMANRERRSVGEVASELMRKGLARGVTSPETRNGIPQLPRQHPFPVITLEFVNKLRDEED